MEKISDWLIVAEQWLIAVYHDGLIYALVGCLSLAFVLAIIDSYADYIENKRGARGE